MFTYLEGDALTESIKKYREYLASILEIIPDDLRIITGNSNGVYLYDSEVVTAEYEASDNSLKIKMNGDFTRPNGYQVWCQYFLEYRDITRYRYIIHNTDIVYPPGGFGDLLFHELLMLEDGGFRHSVLFANGVELEIHFRDFKFDYQIM